MKRTTILILIASMLITFVGLILLQARYVRINAEMIENQFNESVQRSLFQTVILVEENEALQYLAQTLDGYNYKVKPKGIDSMNESNASLDSVAEKLQLNSNKF